MSCSNPIDCLRAKVKALAACSQAQNPISQWGQSTLDNAATIVKAMLSRLDIVNRDDFEQQNDILAQVAARLDALEVKIKALDNADKLPPDS